MADKRTIVATGAHMDDVYYIAGPILAQADRDGHRVVLVTACGDFASWVHSADRVDELRRELPALAERYGCEQILLDHTYHQLEPNVAFKKELAAIFDDVNADVVITHNPDDHWPDHRAVCHASKDAAIFVHGLTPNLQAPMTPLVLCSELAPGQTIHFEPDTVIDVTHQMTEYMEMLAECDHCLSGVPIDEVISREVTLLRDLPEWAAKKLRVSWHGFLRLAQCACWGKLGGVLYGLGLKTLWTCPDEKNTRGWFRQTWPNLM